MTLQTGGRFWLDPAVTKGRQPYLSRNKHGVFVQVIRSQKSFIPILEAAQRVIEADRGKNSTRTLRFQIQKRMMEKEKDETVLVFIEFGNKCDGSPILGTNISPVDDEDDRVIQPLPVQATVQTPNTRTEEHTSEERLFATTFSVGIRSSQFGEAQKKNNLDLKEVMAEVARLDGNKTLGNSSSNKASYSSHDEDDDDEMMSMSESSEDESKFFFC